jgi:tRNA(Ile)-lysidine synthase
VTPEEALDACLSDLELGRDGRPVGLAVSGGGDSTALLHVAAGRRVRHGTPFVAATVDHGLRAGSAEEARAVAAACAPLGVPHETLRWDGWDGRGNLQAAAREARRRLLADWAGRQGAAGVLLAHTADDQAETVLLRLARGSGVDGLGGMRWIVLAHGTTFARPFLDLTREDLRSWARARGIAWAEDPSNEDPRFDRARARAMMGHLAELGLTRERLVRMAEHMARARTTLNLRAADEAGRVATTEEGALLLPGSLLASLASSDTSGRLLAAALMWVGGRQHRPRWEALRRLAASVSAGRAATLSGCRVSLAGDLVRIAPEPGRARPRDGAWDFATFVGAGEEDGWGS